jgi:hypothetical protein
MKLLITSLALAYLSAQALGRTVSHKVGSYVLTEHPDSEKRAVLQDIVRPIEANP